MTSNGLIVAAFGRHYEVQLTDGSRVTGYPRGKKSTYVCGDQVELSPDGQLLAHAPRTSLLYRSDAFRQKLIAANVTQLMLVVATEPAFSDALLTRALVAAEHEGIRPLIVLNKCDLHTRLADARAQLEMYQTLGYRVVELAACQDASPLRDIISGETTLLMGQSGMGKSTLINALIPDAGAQTREISTALDTGKHTTTHARIYHTPEGDLLIDSPGLQEFGLAHLRLGEIEFGFIDFRAYLGACRFRDCRHQNEPDCAIKQAALTGAVHPRRLEQFQQMTANAAAPL